MTPTQYGKLIDAATPGPWELHHDDFTVSIRIGNAYVQAPYQPPYGRGECPHQLADGKLIATSRTLAPHFRRLWEACLVEERLRAAAMKEEANSGSPLVALAQLAEAVRVKRQALSDLEAAK